MDCWDCYVAGFSVPASHFVVYAVTMLGPGDNYSHWEYEGPCCYKHFEEVKERWLNSRTP